MLTDSGLRLEGMKALIAAVGEVNAERFLCLVKQDSFDYTEWQRGLWSGKSLDEIHELAAGVDRRSS